MTIEQLLTALIASVDANTAAIIAQKAPPLPASIPALDKTVTVEDLQTLCTQIVRKDRTKKAGIVAVLGEYNANLISDIATHHYSAIKAKLEAINV